MLFQLSSWLNSIPLHRQNILNSIISSNNLEPHTSVIEVSWLNTRSTEQLEVCMSTTNLKATLKYKNSWLSIIRILHHSQIRLALSPTSSFQSISPSFGSFFFLIFLNACYISRRNFYWIPIKFLFYMFHYDWDLFLHICQKFSGKFLIFKRFQVINFQQHLIIIQFWQIKWIK